jgi:hypothetical protein
VRIASDLPPLLQREKKVACTAILFFFKMPKEAKEPSRKRLKIK